MNILWSRVEGETEFLVAFPGAEQQRLIFTAAEQWQGDPIFRHITAIAAGNEPVLFTRSGTEPFHLQSRPLGSAGTGAPTQEIDVSFAPSLEPMQAQLFLARVSAKDVVFQTGPRIDWPPQHPAYDPAQAAKVATAIRATGEFQDFLRGAERLKEAFETIFISATPLRTEQPGAGELAGTLGMMVAPALDLWPHLSLSGTLQVVRESNRNEMPRPRNALTAEYNGKTQLFKDEIELHVTGDRAVAQSLWLCQVRRQGVAGYELLARAEPEVQRVFGSAVGASLEHALHLEQGADGRHSTHVEDMVVARGDWFVLGSLDAELNLEWLEDPDGNRYRDVRSFPLGSGVGPRANVIPWRHDGRTVKTLPDSTALEKASAEVSRGLIAEALKRWSNPDRDFSIFGLWGILLNSLKPPLGVPGDKRREEFERRIIGEDRRVRRRLLAQHSPFVGLAALARWLALNPGKSGERWQAGLGRDDGGSIERLLSPIAEWLAQDRGGAIFAIAPADINSDVAGDFLRWAKGIGRVKLNSPRAVGRSENNAALALLLLLDTALAEQAEEIAVVLTLAEVGEPRAHELIGTFARIFFPDNKLIARRDADFGFYRGFMLFAGKATTDGERRLRSLYDGTPADLTCSIQDLNGAPLDDFESLADFDAIFAKLTEAFRHLQRDAGKGFESLTDLRASIANAPRRVTAERLLALANRIAAKHRRAFLSKDSAAAFVDLIGELAKPIRDVRGHARRALVLKRLQQLEGELNASFAEAQKLRRELDRNHAMADEVMDELLEPVRTADSDQVKGRAIAIAKCSIARAQATGHGLSDPDTALELVVTRQQRDVDDISDELASRNWPGDIAARRAAQQAANKKIEKTEGMLDYARDLLRRFRNSSLELDLRHVDELDLRLAEIRGVIAEIEKSIAELRLI